MDGDEGLEVAMALDQVHNVLHLDLRVSRGALIGFRAGIGTGTGAWTQKFGWKHAWKLASSL